MGKAGEDLALTYLQGLGYKILARNYRKPFGEVDIIADDGGILVFVEVKTRAGIGFGPPFEAVTPRKQMQMSKVALEYIGRHGMTDRPARFDVVGVLFAAPEFSAAATPQVELLKDAFDLRYGV
jgi:putative endonuclease